MAKTTKTKAKPSKPHGRRAQASTTGAAKRPAARTQAQSAAPLIPGQYFLHPEPITANADRKAIELSVANTGDRPIQVGSHYHFFEVNRALHFTRRRAYGLRLDIPAGTAVRFEPGQTKTVALIPLAGQREVWGLNARVNGPLDEGET